MTLKLIHEASTYKDYLKSKNNSHGICMGISIEWLVGIMDNRALTFGPPESHYVRGLSRQNSCGEFYEYSRLGTRYTREAFYVERTFQNELGLPARVKKINEYLFSRILRNDHVKRYLLTIPHRKGLNVAATMTWRFPSGRSHAVAIFKNKINEKIYFYDPNDGVYEWNETDLDLYYEIKEHIKRNHRSQTMLNSVVLTETDRHLSLNRESAF